jgi:protein-tyrosine phosphatase
MVDVHTHIIYGVDDGSPSIKESIRMVLEAEKSGIHAIFATPHYYKDHCQLRVIEENFNDLKERVSGCGVELYMGSEIFLTPDTLDLVKNNKSIRLNGSQYVLIELPFDIVPAYSYDTLFSLHLENFIPIIAHPERNRYFVNNFDAFMEFVEKGCLLQLDAASIIGIYGVNVMNFAKRLIKYGLAHFVASDAHSSKDYADWYRAAKQKVEKWAGREQADRLFSGNPRAILNNEGGLLPRKSH